MILILTNVNAVKPLSFRNNVYCAISRDSETRLWFCRDQSLQEDFSYGYFFSFFVQNEKNYNNRNNMK